MLPKGFNIEIYSNKIPNARSLTVGDDGTVYVGSRGSGKIYALPDYDKNGKPDETIVVARGLTMPIGVDFFKGDLFVAEVSRIVVFRNIGQNFTTAPKPEVVYDWFPKDLHHGAKYLRVGPDGKLYAPVGAPCNICKSKKPIYATITRLNPMEAVLKSSPKAFGIRSDSIGIRKLRNFGSPKMDATGWAMTFHPTN